MHLESTGNPHIDNRDFTYGEKILYIVTIDPGKKKKKIDIKRKCQ